MTQHKTAVAVTRPDVDDVRKIKRNRKKIQEKIVKEKHENFAYNGNNYLRFL